MGLDSFKENLNSMFLNTVRNSRFFKRLLKYFCIFSAILIILFLGSNKYPAIATSQSNSNIHKQNEQNEQHVNEQEAIVVLGNHKLFELSDKIGTSTPQMRAEKASEIITKIADNSQFQSSDLKVVDSSNKSLIVYKKQPIISVFDVDGHSMNLPRKELALNYKEDIIQAISKYKQERTPQSILIDIGKAVIATSIFATIVNFLLRFRKILKKRLLFFNNSEPAFAILNFKQNFIKNELITGQIIKLTLKILDTALWLFLFVGFFAFFELLLNFFPWTQSLASSIYKTLSLSLLEIIKAIINFVPNLVFLLVLSFLSYNAFKILKNFFLKIEKGHLNIPGFEKDWAKPTSGIIQILLFILVAIVAYPYLPGSGTGALQGISLFLGILFSLGSSTILTNIVAGVFLTYNRHLKIGSLIELDDVKGVIVEKGLLSIEISTSENNFIVTIPNSKIISSKITNYRYFKSNSIDLELIKNQEPLYTIQLKIHSKLPLAQNEAILKKIIQSIPEFSLDPKPELVLKSVDFNTTIVYDILFNTDYPTKLKQIEIRIRKEFYEATRERETILNN